MQQWGFPLATKNPNKREKKTRITKEFQAKGPNNLIPHNKQKVPQNGRP